MIQSLHSSINALADEHQVTVLELDISAEPAPARIRLTVDAPEGVTIGAITRLTKALKKSDELALTLGHDDYRVEISSPGERFGLRLPWQFSRHLEKSLKVWLKDPTSADSVVKGVLKQVADSGITLLVERTDRAVGWHEIEKAVVITDW